MAICLEAFMKSKLKVSQDYSEKQEKKVAKELKAQQTRGSGRGNEKMDSRLKGFFRVDNKCTQALSYSLKLKDLKKYELDTLGFKEWPMIQLEFISEDAKLLGAYAVIPYYALLELLDASTS